jgi:hypothetical protein
MYFIRMARPGKTGSAEGAMSTTAWIILLLLAMAAGSYAYRRWGRAVARGVVEGVLLAMAVLYIGLTGIFSFRK